LNSEFKDIRAFGSDGNLALLNAVAICYPSPLHITCSDHKKSNIERKLGEYKATKAATEHVLSDIFGRKLGSVYEKGFIDSEDTRNVGPISKGYFPLYAPAACTTYRFLKTSG
jgi:hypothetical protein